jgi:hypothetical protein
MLHFLETDVDTECSSTVSAEEPLNVSVLVMTDTELLETRRLTEDTDIDLDRLNDYVLSNFLPKFP